MARLETDIVAKSSFYAGVVQAYSPEELPEDMRTNGNTLLHDIVKSLSNAKDVDNGDFIGTDFEVDEEGILRDSEGNLISNVTVVGVISSNRKLEETGKLEFFSEYAMNANVYCITVDEDENVYVRTHLPAGTKCIVIGVKPIEITSINENGSNYLFISCRKACEQYVVDLLGFRIATLYQMSTAEGLASCMIISLNTAKRPYVNHVNEADPVLGMKKLLNRGSFINNFEKGY